MIVSSRFSLFLIQLWIGSISCAVYHIVPSPSHDCPVESCLTLSSFIDDVSLYLDNNTSLIFQPGNHTMRSKLNITNVTEFLMTSYSAMANQSSLHIICETPLLSCFIFEAVDYVYITSLNFNFFGCEQKIFEIDFTEQESILIEAIASSLMLLGCTFENNEGSIIMISAGYSNITVTQTTFSNNTVFSILSYYLCNSKFANSTFISNEVTLHGISVATLSNTLMFIGCEFRNNNIDNGLGTLVSVRNSDISIVDTRFINNRAKSSLYIFDSIVSIDKSVFQHNYGSAITFRECTVNIFDSVYDSNQGRGHNLGGAITSHDSNIHIHSSEFKRNFAKFTGGAMHCEASLIFVYETCTLTDNHAKQGGAVYLHRHVQYHICHGATVIIANNTASAEGGGIYLDLRCSLTVHSQSTLHLLENFALFCGGGIYAFQLSSINATSSNTNSVIHFYKNKAREGGGLYLDFNSIVCTGKHHNNSISFHENSAEYGGAVYVHVPTLQYLVPECFFQSLPHSTPTYNITIDTDPGKRSKENDLAFKFSLNMSGYF